MITRPTLEQVSNGTGLVCPGCKTYTSIDNSFPVGKPNLEITITCDDCGEDIYDGPADPDVKVGAPLSEFSWQTSIESLYTTPKITSNQLEWKAPTDERTKGTTNFLYGQSRLDPSASKFQGSFEIDEPSDYFRKAFLQGIDGVDYDGEELPGYPAVSQTCPVCEDTFYEEDEDWVEQDGVKFCSVDCLNEEVN